MSVPPKITLRFLRVWQRNFTVYRKTWRISAMPPLLEPLLYLAAFGMGLANMVGQTSYRGEPVPYTEFIAPGLIAINIMQSAYFENTYASFVRMIFQKTYDALLATPLTMPEVILGELFWGATKSVIGTMLMMVVLFPFNLLHFPDAFLLLLVALLGGFAFACAGMICTAIVPTIEVFNLPIFLFITPMFLFSGTFFPLENLPGWAQIVAKTLPLTHLVDLVRAIALGRLGLFSGIPVLYLIGMCAILLPLALIGIQRRMFR